MFFICHSPRGTRDGRGHTPSSCPSELGSVEGHLRSRGLFLPESAADRAIRYHPSCPFAGSRTPAMICLIRDVKTDERKAIQVHRRIHAIDAKGGRYSAGDHTTPLKLCRSAQRRTRAGAEG
jgi:hypothetical protein